MYGKGEWGGKEGREREELEKEVGNVGWLVFFFFGEEGGKRRGFGFLNTGSGAETDVSNR